MKPVKTSRSNFVYRGPTLDIGDAWVERVTVRLPEGPVNVVYMDWQPTDQEREVLATKGVIRLGIWGMEPIPPVSLELRPDLEVVDENPPPIPEASR
jgi:hypothetical protein